jgi:hypothetical protein
MQEGKPPVKPEEEEIKEKITSLGIAPPSGKSKTAKIVLAVLAIFFLLASVPAAVYLVKQRQEIRKAAVGQEVLTVNVTEDDKGRYGIPGEKTGSHAYCCVDHDTLEVSSPKESFAEVDKIIIESHDHTASVAIKLDAHAETGWQNVDDFDVGSRNEKVCDEDGPYYPDHEAPNYTHNEADSCYKNHTTSLGCQKIDKIRMKFYSTDDDPQKDKGEHLHIKKVIWYFCPAYELSCNNVVPYTSDWEEIGDDDWANLVLPTIVNFVVEGSCDEPQGITKARFRISGGVWQEVSNPSQKYQGNFYWPYELTETGDYSVEAEVYNPGLGWR